MVFLSVSISATAYDFEADGIGYTITSYSDLECEVSSYEGTMKTVKIPSTVSYKDKELKVISIGLGAFRNNMDISEIELGQYILKVDDSAFNGCTQLKKIILNEGIKELGKYSFSGCSSLENISLPHTLLNIYEGAFYGCDNLDKITLPNNIKIVHSKVFSGCSALKSISILHIEEIGESSFEDCINLEAIVLGDNLSKIGNKAFKGCLSLYSIDFPHNLKNIGEEVFAYTNLSNFYIPDNIANIGKNSLLGCDKIRTINIGANIMEITGTSIWGCNQVDSLIFRNSDNPLIFNGDSSLFSNIYLPHYTDEIENSAFEKLRVKYVEINRDIMFLNSYSYSFGSYLSGSRKFSAPFSYNNYIETLVLGGSFILDSDYGNVTSGGPDPYIKYSYIRHWLFNDCNNLKNIVLNSPETSIPSHFFSNCTNLTSIKSNNITNIGKEAFSGCTNLNKIELPEIKLIEENAFLNCPLENCSFSSSLLSLTNSISSCPLKLIEIDNPTPPQAEAFLNQTYINCVLKVPYNHSTEYKNISPWNNFWNIEELTEIKAEKIILSNNMFTIPVNETSKLNAEIYPANTSVKHIEWTSSDSTIAIVDQDGYVTGLSTGETIITALCGDIMASCKVKVVEKVGFKDVNNTITYNDMSLSTNDSYFTYIPQIVGPFNEDDFWIELWFLDKDNKYDQHVATISAGDYAGNYVYTNIDRPMWAGKYIFNLVPKRTNTDVVVDPSRAYLTVNQTSNNLEWNSGSPISIKIGEKVDLGISYQADLWCTFNTDYNNELIELSSDRANGNDPHWYATGLKTGETTLYFGIECKKNDMGFYDFTNSSTLSKRIKIETSSGINEVTKDDSSVYVTTNRGKILVHNKDINELVKIYTIDGSIITTTMDNEVCNLANGLYIVTIANKSFKIKI